MLVPFKNQHFSFLLYGKGDKMNDIIEMVKKIPGKEDVNVVPVKEEPKDEDEDDEIEFDEDEDVDDDDIEGEEPA